MVLVTLHGVTMLGLLHTFSLEATVPKHQNTVRHAADLSLKRGEELFNLDDWQHSPTGCILSFLCGVTKSNQQDQKGWFCLCSLGKITLWMESFLESHKSAREEERM